MVIKCEIKEIRFTQLDIEKYFEIKRIKEIEIMTSFFDKEKKEWVVPVKITKEE